MKSCASLSLLLVLLSVGTVSLTGCGMTNCVAQGTMITTPTGARPIESLAVGDEVMSITADGQIGVSVVQNTQAARVRTVHRLSFEDGRTLEVTAEHPIRVGDRWIDAGLIEPSSEVSGDDESARLVSNQKIFRETTVYNLTVEPQQTFLANGILVHNKSIPSPPTPEDMAGPWIMRGLDGIWYRFDLNADGTGTARLTTWKVVWNEGVKYEFKPVELVAWSLTGTKIWTQLRRGSGEMVLLEGYASENGVRMHGSFSFQHGLIVERPEVLRAKLDLLDSPTTAQTQPASD